MNTFEDAVEVGRGIYRCGSKRVNWYLVREDERFTVVDTGFPAHYPQLLDTLEELGAEVADIEGCLLTHAHPDHIGFAERLRTQIGAPARLHPSGVQRAQEGGNPPLGEFLKNLWRPAVLAYFVEVARSKGISVPPVTASRGPARWRRRSPGCKRREGYLLDRGLASADF